MKIALLYSTPDYHKLVEYAARRCYDSFSKCGADSHNFIRGIMKKGHLSIAGHGNIVFGLSDIDKEGKIDVTYALAAFKEINNFIRWSSDPSSQWDYVVSMNALTLTDIMRGLTENRLDFPHFDEALNSELFKGIIEAVSVVPSLRFFTDKTYAIEGSDNPYLDHETDLLNPTVLSADYTALKNAGLTDYELDLHSTVTVEIVSDRAMSLQDARHVDMMGRSEISQRYVSMENFKYRVPVGMSADDVIYTEAGGLIEIRYRDIMDTIAISYEKIMEYAKAQGLNALRAKELARSVLPNATYSTYIDSRPLRQWKHFFHLRDDKHAQNEKQQDAQALLTAFRGVGVPV